MYPFEKLDQDARRTLVLAQEEAQRSGSSYIGTEHLLLGMLTDQGGAGFTLLEGFGVRIEHVRRAIESAGRSEHTAGQDPIPTSRVKRVIEIAFEEARRMSSENVTSGHILIGLVVEGEGIAAHVLKGLGVGAQQVVAAVEHQPEPPDTRGFPEPTNIAALRDKLASVRILLQHAIEAGDTEHALRLGSEESRLERELAKARRT